jgi:hypothetical protein
LKTLTLNEVALAEASVRVIGPSFVGGLWATTGASVCGRY